jgi:hypothetical protein
MNRRIFVRSGIAGIGSALLVQKVVAGVPICPDVLNRRCPPPDGDNGVSPVIVRSHTTPIGGVANKFVVGGMSGTDLALAYSHHVGLRTYYYNLGEDLQMRSDINTYGSTVTPSPSNTTVNTILAEVQSHGAPAWNYNLVSNLLTFASSSDITDGINYANSQGVDAVLQASNRLIAQAQKDHGGGGGGDGQLASDCQNMKHIQNTIFLLAVIYGLATPWCPPCAAMAGGLALTGAFLRLMNTC